MARSGTHHRLFTKAIAILLLIAVASPAALHAGQAVQFCFGTPYMFNVADMHSERDEHVETSPDGEDCHTHYMAETDTPASADPEPVDATRHVCEWDDACTCHFEQAPLNDRNWTVPNTSAAVESPEATEIIPNGHTGLQPLSALAANPYPSPPIYLLNRTFLN